jgi:hypothetical protein
MTQQPKERDLRNWTQPAPEQPSHGHTDAISTLRPIR